MRAYPERVPTLWLAPASPWKMVACKNEWLPPLNLPPSSWPQPRWVLQNICWTQEARQSSNREITSKNDCPLFAPDFVIFHRFVALRVFCWSLGPRLGSDSEGCRHLEFYESCLLFAPKFCYFLPIRRLESVLVEPGAIGLI